MAYHVTVDRLPTQALFDLKGPQAALSEWCGEALPGFPTRPNSRQVSGNAMLCHLGPNRWLLRAPLEDEASLETALRPRDAPPEISVVRVSDTMAFFRITGPAAAEVLQIGCPLDLHPTAFPVDAASYSEFFGLKALVMRCENGFDVAVEQSFGPMLADYLRRALA
jgi:heterotetrameric sarcosine oxidase gamma subunit